MTKNRVPRWVAVAVPFIIIGGAAFCIIFYGPAIVRDRIPAPSQSLPPSTVATGEPPFGWFESRFIGHRDDSIVAQYGPPTGRINGHYGNPSVSYRRAYPEAFTLVYTKPTGSLYLSFCQQRGKWFCFSASWLPEGSAF